MKLKLVTAPVLEPISISELKEHLRVDSETLAGNLTTYRSLSHVSHAVADNYTTHVGTGISVIGKRAVVNLVSGTNGTDGTNDTRIEESDSLATGYTAWTGGAFTQVTEANDNAIQEIEYTGSKAYIRTASKVLVAACVFGTEVIVEEATVADEDDLTDAITDGREEAETITRRYILTQTWDAYLDKWPDKDHITFPGGNLQSVTHVKYKDSDGTETTMTVDTEYIVETNGEGYGRIVLPYGVSWPSFTPYSSNPIVIRFVAGWTTAALVPKNIKRAVKLAAEDAYYHGDRHDVLEPAIKNLLIPAWKLWKEF